MVPISYYKITFIGPSNAQQGQKWIFLVDKLNDTYKSFEVGQQYQLSSEEIEFIPRELYQVVSIQGGISDGDQNGFLNAYGEQVQIYDDTELRGLITGKADKTDIVTSLDNLSDVDASNKTNGYALIYNSTTQKFEVRPIPGGAGGGATDLGGLNDVDVVDTIPSDGNALVYDSTAGKWKPGTVRTGVQDVAASGVNGNIVVDGSEVKVFDDASIQTSLASKANIVHTHTISQITDIDVTIKNAGYTLIYDSTAGKFVSKAPPVTGSTISSSSTNGNIKVDGNETIVYNDSAVRTLINGKADVNHTHTLANITDIDVTGKLNGYALIYDSTSGKFKAQAIPASTETPVVQDAFTGNANTTKNYDSDMTNFAITNSGASVLSFVINGITINVNPSSTFDDAFEPFREIDIAASDSFSAIVKGKPKLTVTASLSGGTYNTTQTVTLTASKDNSTIYYTTDGSTPTTSSTVYSGDITIAATTTLKFFAKDDTGKTSIVYTITYTIDNGSGGTIDWTYDFIVPSGTGGAVYTLTSDASWTHTLTNQDVYGPALDGVSGKVKLLTLGVQDGSPDEPGQEVPREGFDVFAAPSMHGSYQFDSDLQQIIFQSGAMNPYYFRIVKYV